MVSAVCHPTRTVHDSHRNTYQTAPLMHCPNSQYNPAWLDSLSPADKKAALVNHIHATVSHYDGVITIWVSEISTPPPSHHPHRHPHRLPIISAASATSHATRITSLSTPTTETGFPRTS